MILCIRIPDASSFVPSVPQKRQLRTSSRSSSIANLPPSAHRRQTSSLWVVADAEEKEKKGNNHSDSSPWRETANGGYLPNISRSPITVESMEDYKRVVADEKDLLVCVRFYAPWCRACKAIQNKFRQLARKYPTVKFVECPLTQANAVLHQGLAVPSLPFGHIYHPAVGLVEERKIGRKVFDEFATVLDTYVQESCDIDWTKAGAMGDAHDFLEEQPPLQ